jgi:large subunit ribosomal protein L19
MFKRGLLQTARAGSGVLRSPVFTQRAGFVIPTKKTNTIDVYKTTPRLIPKGTNPVLETQKELYDEYDPKGWKRQFLNRDEGVSAGDAVRVTKADGSTFVGLTLGVKRRGLGSTILLRTKVHGTAVEMTYSIYNPSITGLDIVRRAAKKKSKAKVYYIRGNVKYDAGDLDAEIRRSERRRK